VALELTSRSVGDITVITCRGRLVETDSAALARELDSLLPYAPSIVLNLAGVGSIDSSGLGFLVRYLARVRQAGGTLKLCALSAKVAEALRITRIASSFEIYDADEAAITSFYGRQGEAQVMTVAPSDVLVADPSVDVQAYVRELLRQAGFGVTTAGNLPDALILLRAVQPRAVVVGAAFRGMRDTTTAQSFNQMADTLGCVELPADFSQHDAADAGRELLDQIRTLLARR
jgi:anti-sigma B factor antagonist